ncbi:transposase [Streptomyces sp. G-G2]|uniref:IS701 family transposase n=1 Tax=Streptomyces sp. G-G2 TaxID=3046201 RepID=UPI0024BB61C6|nr:transposase [Streptomyces sp. G-G2]MDJ0382549.1 transposase [Streptomyces sp. G-G2]
MTTTTIHRSHVQSRPRSRFGPGGREQPGGAAYEAAHGTAHEAVHEAAADLCEAVFGSMRRRDQREKGLQYVRGLLATPGRKSIRNIAQQVGGAAAEQSLHHFIAGSTWDWQPIRTALSQYLEQSSPLSAWVAQPMAIPKGGEHSVGVGRQYDPTRGQMFRGQQAFGIWFTSAEVVTPVGWRLYLPEDEHADHPEHSGHPDDAGATAAGAGAGERPGETYEECAVTGVLDAVRQVGVPHRPVLLDIPGIGTRSTMNRFADAKLPVLARISPATRLLVTDPALPGHGAGTLTARDVLQNVRALRTPVEWADPLYPGQRRTSLVAAVRVMMPDPSPARRRHLTLLGEWTDARSAPTQLWVTDLARPVPVTPAVLLRMTKQARRVSASAARSVQEVGLRDFAGRSLPGWHRHVTMASVAHAARCLSETGMPVGRELV